MWKHGSALLCALTALTLLTTVFTTAAGDPSTLPLLQLADLMYLGAFRLPDATVNGDSFSGGGRPFAYNPATHALFVGTRSGRLGEVTIPSPVSTSNINALPFASMVQGFVDPTEGNLSQVAATDAAIDGLMVYGDRIYGTASIYYDANNTQRVSHYSRSTNLSQSSFLGMSSVWQADHSGFVSGFMALVPAEWQAKLGGPAITGQCCLPVAWRTSWGPSAFAWDPSHIGKGNLVAATPLLYYSSEHRTLGPWDGSNPTYGGTTQINGVAIIAGTRTALFFGRNGTGPFCYGNGTSDQSLVGTNGTDNEKYCYDPTSSAKGQHAFPYNYQIWAYDLNELAAVSAGLKQPWDVLPYGVWPFSFPFHEPQVLIGGVAYDSVRQVLYVSQLLADQDGYGYRPLIHTLKIGGTAGAPLPPPNSSIPPPTSGSGTATAVTIAADKIAPQAPNTTVTFTATPAGGVSPHQYKWWTYDGAGWVAMVGWTTSNTYAWTPSVANANYRVAVWVRSYGNNLDAQETSTAIDFAISGTAGSAPAPSARATAVTLTVDRVAPQPPGTTITWSATPAGGAAPHQYKWWIYDGGAWVASGGWTTSSTFAWTPATANAAYRVAVWVRSNGNTVDDQETSTAVSFAISGTTPSNPSPAATAVAIAANKPAPQPLGTTITWSATPIGGAAPHQYKWWIYDGAGWFAMGSWTTSSTWDWIPTTANSNYRVGIWVRSAGNGADEAETSTSAPFATMSVSSATVTSVTIGGNRVAPQAPGVTTTFTAVPAGGTGPLQYKWWLYDGQTWTAIGRWSSASTFYWTPTTRNANYKVGVWVKSDGNAADAGEATASIAFAIQ